MRICFILTLFLLPFILFGNNKVSIATTNTSLKATIDINESEYISLNSDVLFLFIDSDKYNFHFKGYPDGEVGDNGDIIYKNQLTLEGDLILKDGVDPGNYNINVILGFQTFTNGMGNIPVELSEDILVKEQISVFPIPVLAGLGFIAIISILLIIRRKSLA